MNDIFFLVENSHDFSDQQLPIARTKNIVMLELDQEVLIYDLDVNNAFCLNDTARTVWQACDGKTTFAELRKNTNPDFSDDLILLTLEKLKKENLLDNYESFTPMFSDLSRREIIKRIGFSSMIALPIIASVVAPSAIYAQSSTCSGPCVMGGNTVTCTFPGISNSATCIANLADRCCSKTLTSGSCGCSAGGCSGSAVCSNCIGAGSTSSGTFPGISSSATCVANLNSNCCSGMSSSGGCGCTPGMGCSGSVVCS